MIPQRLKIWDTIGIISPSGTVSNILQDHFDIWVNFLKNLGFKIKIGEYVSSTTLKYWGSPKEKADDLNNMFADKEVKAIICSQGGANANSTLELLDFDLIQKNPKIFIGLSDITVLLNAIYTKTGIITFHGNDIVFGLGKFRTEYNEQEFKDRIIDGTIGMIKHNSEWKCIREWSAEGILIWGNLGCLTKLAWTSFFPDFTNKILFLEDHDKTTSPEKVECFLSHLKQLGIFEQIKGLWIGHYTHESQITYEEIIMNVVKEYTFPILKCDDFGHNTHNTTIPIGAKVKLDATNKKINIIENCVK